MGTTIIPQKYMHKCDRCGATNETGSSSRPTYWAELIVARDAYDYQGAAVANATTKLLLCEPCTDILIEAINTARKQPAA